MSRVSCGRREELNVGSRRVECGRGERLDMGEFWEEENSALILLY